MASNANASAHNPAVNAHRLKEMENGKKLSK
jgi:hypothetical protein